MSPDDLAVIQDGVLVRLTLEGRLVRTGQTAVEGNNGGSLGLINSQGHPYSSLPLITAVEVLPEQVVEPTWNGTIVRDGVGTLWERDNDYTDGDVWVRRAAGAFNRWPWDRLTGPFKVVFEGEPH